MEVPVGWGRQEEETGLMGYKGDKQIGPVKNNLTEQKGGCWEREGNEPEGTGVSAGWQWGR